jgi:hemin uptake protein HemP
MNMLAHPGARPAGHPAAAPADSAPVHDAEALTGGGATARIILHGQAYTLRITRAGKLILTK